MEEHIPSGGTNGACIDCLTEQMDLLHIPGSQQTKLDIKSCNVLLEQVTKIMVKGVSSRMVLKVFMDKNITRPHTSHPPTPQ